MHKDPWVSVFCGIFDKIHKELGVVLRAGGCREGWLQGEFYRRSLESIITNSSYSCDKRLKVDLRCDSPEAFSINSKMIAEIKVCGGAYFPKCFDGVNGTKTIPSSYKPSKSGRIYPSQIQLANSCGNSLLRESERLRSEKNVSSYLILVRDIGNEETALGQALKHVCLSKKEWILDFRNHGFDVRIWKM